MTAPCVCCNVASVSIATRFLLSSTFQRKVLSMTGLTGNHSTAACVFARVSFVDKPIGPPVSVSAASSTRAQQRCHRIRRALAAIFPILNISGALHFQHSCVSLEESKKRGNFKGRRWGALERRQSYVD